MAYYLYFPDGETIRNAPRYALKTDELALLARVTEKVYKAIKDKFNWPLLRPIGYVVAPLKTCPWKYVEKDDIILLSKELLNDEKELLKVIYRVAVEAIQKKTGAITDEEVEEIVEEFISDELVEYEEDGNYDLWGLARSRRNWTETHLTPLEMGKKTTKISEGLIEIIEIYEKEFKETHILRYTHKEGEVSLELIPISYKHLTNSSRGEVRDHTLAEILRLYRNLNKKYERLEEKFEELELDKEYESRFKSLSEQPDEFLTDDYLDRRLKELKEKLMKSIEKTLSSLTYQNL